MVFFLGQKGLLRRGTLFQGPFFEPLFWPKNPARRAFLAKMAKKGPKTPSLALFVFWRFFCDFLKIVSRGFWHFLPFFGKKGAILAKNPVSDALVFFPSEKRPERRGFGSFLALRAKKVVERRGCFFSGSGIFDQKTPLFFGR